MKKEERERERERERVWQTDRQTETEVGVPGKDWKFGEKQIGKNFGKMVM